MWPKAGSADHREGMATAKRESGGYSDHMHHESKAGTHNVPRIRKLKKATTVDQPSDNKSSEAEAVFISSPTLKRTGRKINITSYLRIRYTIWCRQEGDDD
jgi:hypothetical protein